MKQGWEEVGDWYDSLVGDKGHYYHEHVILPRVTDLLTLTKCRSVLDLACGQGVLARQLPKEVSYTGVDMAPTLLRKASSASPVKEHQFIVADVTKPLKISDVKYDAATLILAAQDMKDLKGAFQNVAKFLGPKGKFIIVMNHPAYRIPRQSGWYTDVYNGTQSRKVTSYLSHLDVPIKTRPSQESESPEVIFYHRPLSYYIQALSECGLAVEWMEEWVSDKLSTGSKAKLENRARKEFPLFLCLVAGRMQGGQVHYRQSSAPVKKEPSHRVGRERPEGEAGRHPRQRRGKPGAR